MTISIIASSFTKYRLRDEWLFDPFADWTDNQKQMFSLLGLAIFISVAIAAFGQ
jgi:hypothetical protein